MRAIKNTTEEPGDENAGAGVYAALPRSPRLAPQLSSQELFRDGNTTVHIEHAGQTYWLRLTRGNKLILTK